MTICTHSTANGEPCNAPAVNDTSSCRHHDPSRPRNTSSRSQESEPLQLPPLHNKLGILSATVVVLHALSETSK